MRVLQAPDLSHTCHASLDWVTLDDLEERAQSHEQDICSDVKPYYYTPSELRRCRGDFNSHKYKAKNEAAKDKEERVVGPGPIYTPDVRGEGQFWALSARSLPLLSRHPVPPGSRTFRGLCSLSPTRLPPVRRPCGLPGGCMKPTLPTRTSGSG
jgi:hypothetical protein